MGSPDEGLEPRKGRAYGVPSRRVQVVKLLTEAYANDDLEEGEFERRIELAEHAETIEELEELVADFPPELLAAAGPPAAMQTSVPVTGQELDREVARLQGIAAPTRVNLIGDQMTSVDRSDPRALQSVSLLGDATVDLRALAGEQGVFLLKITAALGDTRIVVPPGTAVDLRLVTLLGDQKHSKRGSSRWRKLARKLLATPEEPPEPSAPGPTVVVTGFKLLGDTEVVEG